MVRVVHAAAARHDLKNGGLMGLKQWSWLAAGLTVGGVAMMAPCRSSLFLATGVIAATGLVLTFSSGAPPSSRVTLMRWRGGRAAGPLLLAAGASGLMVTGVGWLAYGAGSCH
jgi:hypothetical protein